VGGGGGGGVGVGVGRGEGGGGERMVRWGDLYFASVQQVAWLQ